MIGEKVVCIDSSNWRQEVWDYCCAVPISGRVYVVRGFRPTGCGQAHCLPGLYLVGIFPHRLAHCSMHGFIEPGFAPERFRLLSHMRKEREMTFTFTSGGVESRHAHSAGFGPEVSRSFHPWGSLRLHGSRVSVRPARNFPL